MYEIKIITTFSGAHSLRDYPGNCRNIHGHNWKVEVIMQGNKLDNLGMSLDFRMLKQETENLLKTFDHTYLNENPPFNTLNPTAENLAYWIFKSLSAKLNNDRARVSRISVWENESSSATYYE